MTGFKWSKLYPRSWRSEFGDEFDDFNEKRGVRFPDAVDIILRATLLRVNQLARLWPFASAWMAVGFLNLYAIEVQWAAGALLLSAFVASLIRPQKWLHYACYFFVVIPLSSLLLYQDTTIKHAPLYQTAIAILPSVFGALLGRFSGLTYRSLLRRQP